MENPALASAGDERGLVIAVRDLKVGVKTSYFNWLRSSNCYSSFSGFCVARSTLAMRFSYMSSIALKISVCSSSIF
tara:strand:+ start:20 stop:247 length:228 start_codon:yes stop_codon:yes gene_type:complete